MKNVIIINGVGGSGKDTFVKYCKDYLRNLYIKTFNLSTVDKVREAAKILGWDGKKDEKSRKFLSDLKDISTEYNSGPFNYINEQIRKNLNENNVFFVHSREPEEIYKFKNYYNEKCLTLLIDRGIEINSNHSDKNVKKFKYDIIIENSGSLAELKEKAIDFCSLFLLKE